MAYRVEYAKSARGKCSACKEPIPEGGVRLTVQSTDEKKHYSSNRHLECVTARVASNVLKAHSAVDELPGLGELKEKDQEAVRKRFEELASPGEGEEKKAPAAKKAAKPKKAEEEEEGEGEEEGADVAKPQKKAAPKRKAAAATGGEKSEKAKSHKKKEPAAKKKKEGEEEEGGQGGDDGHDAEQAHDQDSE